MRLGGTRDKTLTGFEMQRPITLADLPQAVLDRIVERTSGIAELQTRSNVALVSKAFASAARKIRDLSVSGQNFISTGCLLKAETLDRMQAAFGQIAVLHTEKLSQVQVPCVFQVIRSCQRLEVCMSNGSQTQRLYAGVVWWLTAC